MCVCVCVCVYKMFTLISSNYITPLHFKIKIHSNLQPLHDSSCKTHYGDFMTAHIGNNPFYTWRSIIEGRIVLEKGLIWRVGNGTNINIKDSPWVPNMPNYKVQMKNGQTNDIEWVNQLLLHNPRRWNSEIIEDTLTDTKQPCFNKFL